MSITPLVPDGQWSATELQVINWGGFHGHHRMKFAPGATLITGTSGSGKSTLLDAVIAVLMTHTTAFNGASNDSVGGPVRSGQQRSIITYVRGKRDTAVDEADGRLTDKVLRGENEPAWGAVALTFVNSDRRRFTVLRTYFVPASATRMDAVTERRFTVPGEFNLADIEPLRETRFAPEPMKRQFPGVRHYSSYPEFRQAFCTKLGIGQADQGENALKLLSRIQAAHPLTTVDRLYKEMVLERPDTLARADQCLAHFAALDQAYRDLETAGLKEEALRGIGDDYKAWRDSSDKADRIDRFGVTRPVSVTPFRLWQLRHKRRLLDARERALRSELDEARSAHSAAQMKVAGLVQQERALERQRREEGGDALEKLESDIAVAKAELADVRVRLERLEADTSLLDASFSSRADFDKARTVAAEFLERYDREYAALSDERDELVGRLPELKHALEDVKVELRSFSGRDGNIPPSLDEARKAIAAACGLQPSDLPFAAELIDIDPQHEQWRAAAEATLHGVGKTMLMDVRRQQHIRTTIDRLDLPARVQFDGVDLSAPSTYQPDPRYISGRLVFKESPFTAWVKDRVSAGNTDHLCVGDPAELGGSTPKVTINGQTSHGRRGAHGRNRGQEFILGISNEARKNDLRKRLRQLETSQQQVQGRIEHLTAEMRAASALQRAHQRVATTEWNLVDVPGRAAAIASLEGQKKALLANSNVLAQIEERLKVVAVELRNARKDEGSTEDRIENLNTEWEEIAEAQDETTTEIAPIEDDNLFQVGEDDDQYLQEKLAERVPEPKWGSFDADAERLRRRLGEESRQEREVAETARQHLVRTFTTFHSRWPDPNRGTGVEAYPEYAAIYDDIIREGLHDRRAKFQRQMQEWSGQDLRLLNNAYSKSREEIEDRMEPVNRFLATVPFGPQQERLQMTWKSVPNPEVDLFRSRLRNLSSDTTKPLDEDEARARFLELREFMAQLGWSETGNGKRADDLLDVRKHVRIGASRFDADNREVGVYESLAGKSGGESQELAAFIIGAALRYQLGDGDQPNPRFAPVFLDEGFVKADWEYAGRAVQAWRSLGFQLIVSAPLDKVTALEPQMESAAVITKDLDSGFSFVTEFPDMRSWAEAQALKDAS